MASAVNATFSVNLMRAFSRHNNILKNIGRFRRSFSDDSSSQSSEGKNAELNKEDDPSENWKARVRGKEEEESIMGDCVDDEDELNRKLAKEPGGKPLDEDKGLDVNWRPIDEKKPPA